MNICQRLGIHIPLLQSPMAGVQDWRLAVAVAKAGGLGAIPCGMLGADKVVAQITEFRSRSTQNYNLNFFCHKMPPVDQQSLDNWEQLLHPHYEQLEAKPPEGMGQLRLPFDQQMADAIEPFKPPVISFHFGLPSAELMQQIKSWGTVIMSSATTLAEAQYLDSHGADIIIAQGIEAGGHRAMFLTTDLDTQIDTAELVRQLSTNISKPIVAAGGIATALNAKTLMGAGAEAVQLGTSLLLCDEALTSDLHRRALCNIERDTCVTNVYSGRPARGIQNLLISSMGEMSEHVPNFPYAAIATAPLRAKAESLQSDEYTPLWSGVDRSGCQRISATEYMQNFWNDITNIPQ